MMTHTHIRTEVEKGYAQWEASAPLLFVVLSAVAIVTVFLAPPTLLFFVLDVATGAGLFACWHFARVQRVKSATVSACLTAGLSAVAAFSHLSLALSMAQGMSIACATAALLFWVGSYVKG
jgi:hypothetical protein